MSTVSPHSRPVVPGFDGRIDLLLIEDDPGDAFLVEELLAESGLDIQMTVARTLGEARRRLIRPVQCIVADLSLPDASGLELLREVLAMAPHSAVVVLTGLNDAHIGVAAVAAGAEDYLVKQDVDAQLLARAIRYAIERKRAEETERQLVEARIRSQENARLARGLLPIPLLSDSTLSHHTSYRPGQRRALLGGDFYDTVQTADGSVHVVIGDVCGHGPDEAALGVALRMAWRTLVLAGHTGGRLLTTLDTVLGHERRNEEIFTTLCMITVEPARRRARMHRAGHPLPLLFDDNGVRTLPDDPCGPALGLIPGTDWPYADVELGEHWGLMLYTDGLIEGFAGPAHHDGGPLRGGPVHDSLLRGGPLHDGPLHDSPLHDSPLHDSPLHDSLLRGGPLHDSPLHGGPLDRDPRGNGHRAGAGRERLDTEGLLVLAERAHRRGDTGDTLVDGLVTEVERLNGEALTDDLAVLLLRRDASRPATPATPAEGTLR